jgi:nucleoside-diphosphate-sugar epimerase
VTKRAIVSGAGGFIGHHLCGYLRDRGYWVRGVDIKRPEFGDTRAHEFRLLDLRDPRSCREALDLEGGGADEVYQLAADMGGMGFIDSAECEIMTHNALINLHMVNAASEAGVGRYFYASSACVYPDQPIGDLELSEKGAYPAQPHNEYGWEKLYAERMALAFARNRGLEVRIARFQNCYGPEGSWRGGREKAPAALCRKVAMAPDGGEIEAWGDGAALRTYVYVKDLVEGVHTLMQSGIREPTNIGRGELSSVRDLIATIARVAGKRVRVRWVPGPVGVSARYHSTERIRSTGWRARHSLEDGIRETYPWIRRQVEALAREGDASGRVAPRDGRADSGAPPPPRAPGQTPP